MLIRRVTRWLSALVVLALTAAPVAAQDDTEAARSHVPVLSYFLAFLFTVLALVVVCVPSRKQ